MKESLSLPPSLPPSLSYQIAVFLFVFCMFFQFFAGLPLRGGGGRSVALLVAGGTDLPTRHRGRRRGLAPQSSQYYVRIILYVFMV